MTDAPAWARWVSGANVPTHTGSRVNVTSPLAELFFDGTQIRLRVRWFGRLFQPVELVARPADLKWVSEVEGWFGMQGIGFCDLADREFYWKGDYIQFILNELASAGFPVIAGVRKAAKMWTLVP